MVCKALMDMAGVKYDATYRITTVDPPELVQFIKDKHPDVKREYPKYKDGTVATMWNLVPRQMMPPTRLVRYCCAALKETGGDGRMTVTGVRWAESSNRKRNQGLVTIMDAASSKIVGDDPNFSKTDRGGVILTNDNADSRRMIEHCYVRHKTTVNPIIDWEHKDVWNFIRGENIPYCRLYDEEWHRLGCIGCPMATTREREKQFMRWPKYKAMYLRAFKKMCEERARRGKDRWNDPNDAKNVFNWWMEYDTLPGQIDLLEDTDGE